jgi:hypothetical protein
VPHGIGLVDPGTGPRFVLMSLGNFIFDQSLFQRTQSFVAIADIDKLPTGGFNVSRLELVPVHVDGYVPKLLAGAWLARTGRQIGHLSTTLPLTPTNSTTPDGLTGAVVFPVNNRVFAAKSASQYTTTDSSEIISVPVTSGSTSTVDYMRVGAADSLASVKTSAAAQVEYGREIMLYGDFEDLDVDNGFFEEDIWDKTTLPYVENSVVRSGTGALVLLRKSSNTSLASFYNDIKITVTPGKKLTLRGYVRGDNAGDFTITTRFYDVDDNVISTTDRFTKVAGTYGWTRYALNFTAPSNAEDMRIYFKQAPPASGEGRAFVDDVALIQWEGVANNAQNGVTLPAPNNWSFVRFNNLAADVTSLGVTFTHRSYAPL